MDKKPLASLFVLSYNQEKYIQETVQSALSQSYTPLEIIISDDCSKDRTFEIIQSEIKKYEGPHRIITNRNEKNIGVAEHINKAWNLSNGDIIVAGAGDDIYLPERTAKLIQRLLDSQHEVDMVVSHFKEIDADGKPTGFIKKNVCFTPDLNEKVYNWKCGATGACVCYKRELFEKYGPLDSQLIAEDWVIPFRAWIESGIAVIEEPLVLHRTHDSSISFMLKNLNRIRDASQRKERRKKSSQNQYAIAKEWLKAWRIKKGKNSGKIDDDLVRLVKIRKMQFDAFESTRYEAFKIAVALFKEIGVLEFLKIIVRHVLRYS